MKNAVFVLLILTTQSYAFEPDKVFNKACSQCHTVGNGDKVGPDLAGLSQRRKLDWLVKFINYPDGMINGDADEPGYEKPDHLAKKVYELYKPQMMAEQEISKEQVEALLKWIDSQNKKPKGKITTLN